MLVRVSELDTSVLVCFTDDHDDWVWQPQYEVSARPMWWCDVHESPGKREEKVCQSWKFAYWGGRTQASDCDLHFEWRFRQP